MSISDQAANLIQNNPVLDMCLPWGPGYKNKESTLPRFKSAGFNFVSLTVGMDRLSIAETIKNIAAERLRIESQPDKYVLVEKAADISEAADQGKLALGFHFQGSEGLAGDKNLVSTYYKLGVRHMLLAYNEKNQAADGCHERTDCGLSRYGLELITEMNRVGMLVDLSHTGYRSTMDAMEACEGPCIFSHANAKGVKDHPRNIRDEQIKALAAKKGVIGVNGIGFFLGGDNRASVDNFLNHIEYYSKFIGPQYVGLGLDFVYFHEQMFAIYQANPTRFPEGYSSREEDWDYFPPENLGRLIDGLIERGFSDEEIKDILGGNFLRVVREVWK